MYGILYGVQVFAVVIATYTLYKYCQGKICLVKKEKNSAETLLLGVIIILQIGYLLFLQATDMGGLMLSQKVYQLALVFAVCLWAMCLDKKGYLYMAFAFAAACFILAEGTDAGNYLFYSKTFEQNQFFYYIKTEPAILYIVGRISMKIILAVLFIQMIAKKKEQKEKNDFVIPIVGTGIVLCAGILTGMPLWRHYDIIPVGTCIVEVFILINALAKPKA